MKLRKLFKYSAFLFILSLIIFFILTVYIYYFSRNPAIETAYSFIVPISIFAVSILYSRSVHEKGLLRGIEIWIVYFVMVLLIKVLSGYPAQIRVLYNGAILFMSLLGGIIGVNMKNKSVKS